MKKSQKTYLKIEKKIFKKNLKQKFMCLQTKSSYSMDDPKKSSGKIQEAGK